MVKGVGTETMGASVKKRTSSETLTRARVRDRACRTVSEALTTSFRSCLGKAMLARR